MRTKVIGLACCIAFTLAPAAAHAQWPYAGAQITSPWMGIDHVQMNADGAGGLLVDWIASGGGTRQLHAARLTSTGALSPGWPYEGKFVDYTDDTQAVPDGSGGLTLASTLNYPGPDSYAWQLSAAGSVAWTAAVAASPSVAENNTSIIGDGSGGFYVAWVKFGIGGSNVYVKRLQSNGTLSPGWPAAGVLVSGFTTTYVPSRPALGLAGANGVVVLWPSDYLTAVLVTPSGALSPAWSDGGSAFGGNSPLNTRIVPSDADHFYAVWDDGSGLVATRMAYADGSTDPAWPADGVSIGGGANAGDDQVIPDGAGGFLAAWRSGTSNPRGVRYLADASVASGWSAAGVALNSGATGNWAITSASGAGLIFAWDAPLVSIGRIGYVQWFLGDGSQDPSQPAGGQLVSPTDTLVNIRGALPDGIGGAYIAWAREDLNSDFRYALTISRATYPTPLDVGPRPGSRGLSLALLGANPSRGDFALSCALEGGAPARLELFDVGGRRVRDVALDGGGTRVVRFDDAHLLAPGLYVARLTQAARSRSTRVAIVR